ncbi:MAG: cysteine desulfurase [Patescibacteria group bacterium]
MFDPHSIKEDFPILNNKINSRPLIYLDNASTTQKPKIVIEALKNYYENSNANIPRGIHTLSEKATASYEKTRLNIAKFINATSEKEIIFTRNTTESINLMAYTWGETNIKENNEIIVSAIEHHSNLVPWQQLCQRRQAKLKIIPIKQNLTLDLDQYAKLLSKKTKLVAVTGMSNVLGTIPNLKKIIDLAHQAGAITLVDGAQSVAHSPTDVQELDCDFMAFSAHKMLGPTGIGILYGKYEILNDMPPFLFGGDMVKVVEQYKAYWNDLPWKFEAGTPNIADVIAFDEALKYLEKIGMENVQKHDQKLLKYAVEKFSQYKNQNVKLFLPNDIVNNGGILSFSIKGIHPHDIATIFNEEGVAIRSGHHCSQPLIENLNVLATARISFYIYNTKEDIDLAELALQKTIKIFK